MKRFGRTGLAIGLVRAGVTILRCILSIIKHPTSHKVKVGTAKAILCGAYDFARANWGPPPTWALEDGDIRV